MPYPVETLESRFTHGMAHLMLCCGICCRDKGVNVELGIPYELWDTPSAEVTQMQRKVSLH